MPYSSERRWQLAGQASDYLIFTWWDERVHKEGTPISHLLFANQLRKWLASPSSSPVLIDIYQSIGGQPPPRGTYPLQREEYERLLENQLQRAFLDGRLIALSLPSLVESLGGKAPTGQSAISVQANAVDTTPPTAPGSPRDVVSPEEAKKLFQDFSSRTDIPFNYPSDCCYARAHAMCRIADSQGITCQKDWVFDKGWGTPGTQSSLHPHGQNGKPLLFPDETGVRSPVQWVYHVAPLVQVQQPTGEIVPMVLDPSIAKGPLTRDEWRQIQGNPADARNYITDKETFFYNPIDKTSHTATQEDTEQVFAEHRESRDTALKAEQDLRKTQ